MRVFLKRMFMKLCPGNHNCVRSDAEIKRMIEFLKEFPTLHIPVDVRLGAIYALKWMSGMDSTTAYSSAISLLCDDDPYKDAVHILNRYSVKDKPLCDPHGATPGELVSSKDWDKVTCKQCLNILCVYIQVSNKFYPDYDEKDVEHILERLKEINKERKR